MQVSNNQVVVSSRQIAENFGKHHKDVLDGIRGILNSAEKSAQWFMTDTYKDASGKTNPEYLMNRDGFSFLVMIFFAVGRKSFGKPLDFMPCLN